MCSGPLIALELKRENAVKYWNEICCGPSLDPVLCRTLEQEKEKEKVARAKQQQQAAAAAAATTTGTSSSKATVKEEEVDPSEIAPPAHCLRASYGTDVIRNAVHGSYSVEDAQREISLMFDTFVSQVSTTLCLIKPDITKKGQEDAIIHRLTAEEGFELVARKKLKLTPQQVKILYAHEQDKPYFKALLDFMTSGPVIGLALRKNFAVTQLLTVAGPTNPRTAKKTHPNSLRAIYGTDMQRNAVEASETIQHAANELALIFPEYNFDLLTQ